jgi:hypothetical protein
LVKSATCRKFVNVFKGQVKVNTDYAAKHLELNEFKNPSRNGFSTQAMTHFGLEVPQGDGFVDASSLGLDD